MNALHKLAIIMMSFLILSWGAALAADQTDHSDHIGHNHGAPAAPAPETGMQDHEGHEGHERHDHGGAASQEQAQPAGVKIAQNTVQNHTFSYYLLDKHQREEMMKGMEGMEMHGMSDNPDITNHLMLYIKGPDGKPVSGKIGFIVTGPDGKEAKTLTMGMHGGYGADVSMKSKGVYRIMTKAVIGNQTIKDEFEYTEK